ncbi:MAG TPA: twin-arginine translocase TatA/TatE family subunit [Silvibacterium sp.]|nr:twin-arginine translocase TatA/TatE family subunit [Silvibacterium sp.]
MHFADSIVIFLLALILFGPKKLPEIARQIGKLMAEFRRASNEFKSQINEELQTMEQQERQKKLEAAAAQAAIAPPPQPAADAAATIALEDTPEPVILPPSSGEVISTRRANLPVAPPELLESAAIEPHPLYAEALAAEKNGNSSRESEPENAQATLNHG